MSADLDALIASNRELAESNRAVLAVLDSISAKIDAVTTDLGPTIDAVLESPMVKMVIGKVKR